MHFKLHSAIEGPDVRMSIRLETTSQASLQMSESHKATLAAQGSHNSPEIPRSTAEGDSPNFEVPKARRMNLIQKELKNAPCHHADVKGSH